MDIARLRIRPCLEDDTRTVLAIVNSAAGAYRGKIPADCWHEPYMKESELRSEVAAGVDFVACEVDGAVAGVMGIQPVANVDLIRHAYVRPELQGRGVGAAMMEHLRARTRRPILVGTWAAATWAIRFYERQEFELVAKNTRELLLQTYWTIPERQIETSVVLAAPPLTHAQAMALVASR